MITHNRNPFDNIISEYEVLNDGVAIINQTTLNKILKTEYFKPTFVLGQPLDKSKGEITALYSDDIKVLFFRLFLETKHRTGDTILIFQALKDIYDIFDSELLLKDILNADEHLLDSFYLKIEEEFNHLDNDNFAIIFQELQNYLKDELIRLSDDIRYNHFFENQKLVQF